MQNKSRESRETRPRPVGTKQRTAEDVGVERVASPDKRPNGNLLLSKAVGATQPDQLAERQAANKAAVQAPEPWTAAMAKQSLGSGSSEEGGTTRVETTFTRLEPRRLKP